MLHHVCPQLFKEESKDKLLPPGVTAIQLKLKLQKQLKQKVQRKEKSKCRDGLNHRKLLSSEEQYVFVSPLYQCN